MNAPFLRLVAEDIEKRFGNELADVAIVFNNKRPITYLKKHLSEVYGRAIWSPQFFTIQEFLRQATQETEASPLTQFFYLFELHNELLLQEGASPETMEEFYPIAEIILSDFGQLDYELVNIDEIFMELYDSTQIDIAFQHFTDEQQRFIRQFWQSFSTASHSGMQQRFLSLWKRLPVLYRRFKEKLKQEKQLNYPTLYRDLVEGNVADPNFVQRYQCVLFVGFNALNKAEVHLFKTWQTEQCAIFYFDTDAYYVDDQQQEAGLFIRRNILDHGLMNALGEAPHIIGNRTSAVHLYAAAGKNSQTKLLHDILKAQQDAERSTAILLADESLLVPLLQSLPDTKPNITTGYPLIQSPLYGLLDLWMEVQEELSHFKKKKISFQLLETFANHPLVKLASEQRSQLLHNIADKQLFEIDIQDIIVADSVLPHFFEAVADPKQFIPTLNELLDQLLASQDQEDRIGQIESNLLVETKKVLNQLQLGMVNLRPTSILFQIGLIRKAIQPISSAIEGDPLRGLQIMGLLESRCLNFDQVYILGANEGILPKTSNAPTFLPNSLRLAYGLPVMENQDALSAYLFYRHFQYSEGIHIFYNSLVSESSSGEESRFVKQLQFESKFRFVQHTQQQPIRFQPSPSELVIEKNDLVWESMQRLYFQQRRKISATAITTYLQSPLQFFLKHVAQIKEPPVISYEFEMNRLGTVIHQVMELIFKPYKGLTSWTKSEVLREKKEKVDELVVREIGNQYLSAYTTLDELNSMQRIMHKIASAYVHMYLDYDMENYQAFRIIELENDEDYLLDFPITVDGRQESVRLFGIIDRVDEVITADGQVSTRIVDYKTGGDSVVFNSLDNVFCPNTTNKALLQTLFYAYVFEQVTGRTQLEPHLYVARKMREDGTLFHTAKDTLEGEQLQMAKDTFVPFLRKTLEEIFDPNIPFKHHANAVVYPSDPYTLFYRNATPLDEEEGNP
ncbi:PD-(D/E)XK nuclease family protein [Sphingobacterium griseoflavum]|uniref:PD-(D/E)XK endonuclease-like domain-containing protein n=1 Tax=Sphingobacterium griseoflavum TaxID=1474952 RepID=A0ABQ3I062_9SPHI|nr:PD-(D/E)XK nuclease family protein [Sphingobacterium griseoflavum]GHE37652.1 hypothetical protein GCM10017764_21200 [Sphingobacterium griseoflavum]